MGKGIYEIDDQDVNDREDWRHTPPVSASANPRMETVPGSPVVFTIVPTRLGPTLIVRGFLQASDESELAKAVWAADAMRFDPERHKVVVGGVTYDDCQLIDFQAGGDVSASDGDVLVAVRYVWQETTGGGAS